MKPIEKSNQRRWVPFIIKGMETDLDQDEEEGEPEWVLLREIFEQPHFLFSNILFLEGLDCSSNTYVIVGDYLTVVDPGSDSSGLMHLFDHPEYAPEDIKKIVLTNGDPDHTMGTLDLFRYPGVKNNPELEIILHKNSPREFKTLITRFGARLTEVTGGETLDLAGFLFDVLVTPEKSDLLCLYHAETRTAICGDVALPLESAEPDPHVCQRTPDYLACLRTLLGPEIFFVLPGHGQVANANGSRP